MSKVLHICLCGPFTENMTYQENILTKYHELNGHKVSIITSLWCYDQNGQIIEKKERDYYILQDIHIVRLECKNKFYSKIKKYRDLYYNIEKVDPDIIFIHGVQFMDIVQVVKYIKKTNKSIKVYVDNHADFSNSGTNFLSKNILHKILWKHCAKKIEPYVTKFYGVLPARVDWLVNMYKLPKEKCELLVMGADDEFVDKYKEIQKIREEYNISKDDFVIVTGGKIDKAKIQTLNLMKVIKNIKNDSLKLYVFGSVDKDIKEEFDSLCFENKIIYLGWANSEESYKYFSMADLVIFPGRHSVYWEQVVAMGKPLICKYWDGTTHVDIGGNVKFLNKDNEKEIKEILIYLLKNNKIEFNKMLTKAKNERKNNFLYSSIAKKSIE